LKSNILILALMSFSTVSRCGATGLFDALL
jgi:hypothetical protein